MSFADARAPLLPVTAPWPPPPGGGGAGGGESEGAAAFAACARSLGASVFSLTSGVASFRRSVEALGTGRDTRELRTRLRAARDALGGAARAAGADAARLAELAGGPGAPPGARATLAKLLRDLDAVLHDFQRSQRACADREAAHPAPAAQPQASRVLQSYRPPPPGAPDPLAAHRHRAAGMSDDDEAAADAADAQQQQQQQQQAQQAQQQMLRDRAALAGEVEYNAQLIEEREAGIVEIQAQIGEVNEIFQDLAVLVSEQGLQVDDFEANVSRTAARTRDATVELGRAEGSQRAASGRMLWVLLIVVLLLVSLVLFVVPR